MKRVAIVLIASAVGALLGGWLVWWWVTAGAAPMPPAPTTPAGASPAPAPEPTPASSSAGEPGVSRVPPSRSDAPPAAQDTKAEREESALFSDQLRTFAASEIARGWRELRADDVPGDVVDEGLRDYERQLQTRAHWFGRSAAEQRNQADQRASVLAGADAVAMLAAIKGDEPEAKALVGSDRFASLFAPRGGGSAVDGTTLPRDGKVADGSIVAFPAGVFAVQDFARGNDPYPVDLTVRGAGMDATLLVVDDQAPRGAMQRLLFEDCTVFADGLLDVRSAPAVVALHRVRLIGFDCGAGGSVALDVRGIALRAVACRFESGYGTNPQGYANVLRSRSSQARLVRFERCVFERVDLDDADTKTVVFDDCVFTDMLSGQPQRPTFRNCRYSTIAEDKKWDADYRRRDLNTLFPQWKERLQRR